MTKRKYLVNEFSKYLDESKEQFNAQQVINREKYLNLVAKVSQLEEVDFDKIEDYQNFVKQYLLKKDKSDIEKYFTQDKIDDGLYMKISNYIIWLIDWLK